MNHITYEHFMKKAKEVHGDTYKYPDKETYIDNIKKHNKVPIICKVHGVFMQEPNVHVYSKSGCKKCTYKNRKTKTKISKEEVIKRFRKIHGDKYDYSKVELGKTLKDKVCIICPIHGEFWQSPDKHGRNTEKNPAKGCPKCSKKHSYKPEEWRELARKIRGNHYDYSKANYVNKTTKVEIICPKHGSFWQLPGDHLYKNAGCNVCNASKPERYIWEFLKKEGIRFEYQKTFPGHRYEYDFYLTDLNLLIEYNGIQHYKKIDLYTRRSNYDHKYMVNNDKKKKSLAKQLNIPLIIISYKTPYEKLPDKVMFEISKYYKYRIGNNFYKTLLELGRALNLPPNTTINEVKQYLVYK